MVVNAMLCMGYEMAAVYLHSLKNVAACRTCCAEVMNKVSTLLQSLSNKLSDDDTDGQWMWVPMEHKRVRELISLKNNADIQFKSSNFKGAINNYASALKVCAVACLVYNFKLTAPRYLDDYRWFWSAYH